MAYDVRFKASAAATVEKLPKSLQRRIIAKAEALAEDPRPPGVEKLKGEEGLYRVRVGDYRIVYRIEDKILRILVVRVGHRREVYRGL